MKVLFQSPAEGEPAVTQSRIDTDKLFVWPAGTGGPSLMVSLEDWRALNAKVEEFAATLGGELSEGGGPRPWGTHA